MQAERMQHRRRTLHDYQNGDCESKPESKEDEDRKDAERAGHGEGIVESHFPENDGELLVGEGEGPEAEVGGCVRDAIKAEF